MEEDEGIAFRLMLSYPDIFILLIFYPSKLVRKDLSDLTVSSEENVRKFQSINDPFYKFWIVLEKKQQK